METPKCLLALFVVSMCRTDIANAGKLRLDELTRCTHPLTTYEPPENEKRKGHCKCDAGAVCAGTICRTATSTVSGAKVSGFITQCDDCACIPQNEADAMWQQPLGDEKFVLFRWNAGRMGNQMMTVNYAFQIAFALNRTVYIRCHAGGSYKDKIGMQPDNKGFWDIEYLAKTFSVAFDEACGIPQSKAVKGVAIIAAKDHPTLSNTARYCREDHFRTQILAGRTMDDCHVLDIEGDMSVLWQTTVGFQKPLVFWQALRPVQIIRDFVQAKIESYPMTSPTFSIHHRNSIHESKHTEGAEKVIEMCTKYITSEGKKFGWNAGPPEEDGWMCTLTVNQIEKILARGGVEMDLTEGQQQKWWLLDDFSLCNHKGDCPYMQNELFKHGAVVACNDPHWALGWTCRKEKIIEELEKEAHPSYTQVTHYISPIIDQWIGVMVDFHAGLAGSTFDEMICGMRGESRAAMTNICVGWNKMRQAKAKQII